MDIPIPARRRRTHTASFKQAVINACQVPGASVAGIALAHGLNANQVRRWMRERGVALPARCTAPILNDPPAFVPMPVPSVQRDTLAIRIEVHRGTTAIHVEWPVHAAGDCAVWLRDWLR